MASTKWLMISGPEVAFEVEMPRPATFLQVKQKIKEIANVEVDRQTLFYNQVRMEDDSLVRHIVDRQYDVLDLTVAPLPENPKVSIVVKSQDSEDEPIKIRETQSVDHLRNKISMRLGIFPPENIILIRLSHVMENGHPLSDYFVCQGAEINVMVQPH